VKPAASARIPAIAADCEGAVVVALVVVDQRRLMQRILFARGY
jgi:hypothetical protein